MNIGPFGFICPRGMSKGYVQASLYIGVLFRSVGIEIDVAGTGLDCFCSIYQGKPSVFLKVIYEQNQKSMGDTGAQLQWSYLWRLRARSRLPGCMTRGGCACCCHPLRRRFAGRARVQYWGQIIWVCVCALVKIPPPPPQKKSKTKNEKRTHRKESKSFLLVVPLNKLRHVSTAICSGINESTAPKGRVMLPTFSSSCHLEGTPNRSRALFGMELAGNPGMAHGCWSVSPRDQETSTNCMRNTFQLAVQ